MTKGNKQFLALIWLLSALLGAIFALGWVLRPSGQDAVPAWGMFACLTVNIAVVVSGVVGAMRGRG